jgi:histone-lysine N-methyltransferase SETD1
MKMYDWREVRCDRTGYYIVFENSKRGEDETQRCFKETHMEPLFTYTMNMECHKYGNPNYERSPSPARIAEMDERKKTRLEDEQDFEMEKKERAENLDPSKAALERLLVELRDIIMADIKVKSAAPALFEYLNPDRHAATRKRLGISDPVNTSVQRLFSLNAVEDPSGPMDYTGGYRKSFGRFERNRQRLDGRSAFSDERRRRPAQRLVQPLHKRLQDFFDSDESDDERRTTFTKGSDGLDSRAISEAAKSPARFEQDDDDKKPRRGDAGWGADSDDEGVDATVRKSLGHLLHKEPEDMATAELEQILSALPRSSKLRKRAMTEVKLRRKAMADDQLFFSEENERKLSASVDDIKLEDTESAVATPEPDVAKPSKKKAAKPKKRTKKQLQEQEAAERAEAEATLDKFIEQDETETEEPAPGAVQDAVLEELTPEVEWGVSATEPRRTVQDDWSIIMDLDGWQQFVKDDEDLKFLRLALQSVAPLDLGDADLWAWNEKQFKALNRDGLYGVAYDAVSIPGYYVPNSTGSARTEGYRKIKESEKSMYLPHRIKVQNLRKERQAQAKKNKTSTPEPAGKGQKTSKMSSRTNRAEHRRLQNDLLTSKQAFGMDTDAVRFNQLKKRKKFVRFDRSSIHGWGLYAEENISMGDMIIEYVGEKVRQRVADMREVMYTKQGIGSSYLFRIDDDMVIDATKKGGIARFINHSCMPNCTAKIIKVDGTKRIVIYALRDIVKGASIKVHVHC